MAAKVFQFPPGASLGLEAVVIGCMMVSHALFSHCEAKSTSMSSMNSAGVAVSDVDESNPNAEPMISEHARNQPMMSGQVLKPICIYNITTVTGKKFGAGTDSRISLRLSNNASQEVYFPDLDNAKNNFERGDVDHFEETGNCVDHICKMILYTDNSGFMPAWYVDTLGVSVKTPTVGIQETTLQLHEWLPKDDSTAAFFDIRDNC